MELIHIKLKNGQDLIGVDLGNTIGCCNIENPVQVKIHPTQGFYAQSWLLFSEEKSVVINDDDILVKGKANQRAVDCYTSFFEERFLDDLEGEPESEIEEHLMALIDSKSAVKH